MALFCQWTAPTLLKYWTRISRPRYLVQPTESCDGNKWTSRLNRKSPLRLEWGLAIHANELALYRTRFQFDCALSKSYNFNLH
jgi:hypothetical protein